MRITIGAAIVVAVGASVLRSQVAMPTAPASIRLSTGASAQPSGRPAGAGVAAASKVSFGRAPTPYGPAPTPQRPAGAPVPAKDAGAPTLGPCQVAYVASRDQRNPVVEMQVRCP